MSRARMRESSTDMVQSFVGSTNEGSYRREQASRETRGQQSALSTIVLADADHGNAGKGSMCGWAAEKKSR
jgi:hypothetical protein